MNLHSPKIQGLGVFRREDKIILYYKKLPKPDTVLASQSIDGVNFEKIDGTFEIFSKRGKKVDPKKISKFTFSKIFKSYILSFDSYLAVPDAGTNWKIVKKLKSGITAGQIADSFVHKDRHVFYFGGEKITVGLTDDGSKWNFLPTDIKKGGEISIDFVKKTKNGILVIFDFYENENLRIHAALFDLKNPSAVLWETKASLWPEPEIWQGKRAECFGFADFENKLLSFWNVRGGGIYLIANPIYKKEPAHEHHHLKLKKHPGNPILSPKAENNWENDATFNAAAFYEDGKVYLIYRAVGHDYISVLGYAESTDGVHFEKRLDKPIYTGHEIFDRLHPKSDLQTAVAFASGGSWGGVEDPRITKIGNRLYMIYVAFNGYEPPRLALTSILYEDFRRQRFLWEKPVLISPPGIIDKSGAILPEKINGKYVIFHRIYPDILVDFVDSLEFDGETWLKGEYKISPRPTMWDSRKVGGGAPPIKTDEGWLMIYQGVGEEDSSKYKIGAMLLDLKDPTKVIYRTNHPILEPEEHYENSLAKFGVVYPCGAIVKEGNLIVYYGGSDSVTCAAEANLSEFLGELKKGSEPELIPLAI